MTVATPLSVQGRFIVDANGKRQKLCGANWPGGHQDTPSAPGGLDFRHRDEIAAQLAEWGLNSVRLTFAVGSVTSPVIIPNAMLAANPDLFGMTAWQVYQACVRSLTTAGLMVIPNCHILYPGWCCSDNDGQGLWWNASWPASRFVSTWVTVATAFKNDPLVIGYDIKNEPRKAIINGVTYTPTWGDGNTKTDFAHMYANMADVIHGVSPGKLIFCEGLSYAGDLTKAGAHPVTPTIRPANVVYSMHEYSWFHPDGQSEADYLNSMNAKAGYLMQQGIAPVWVGEFGTGNDCRAAAGVTTVHGASGPGDWSLGAWFNHFLTWARETDADWCLWHLGGSHRKGTTPQTNVLQYAEGDRATYGLFAQSWQGVSSTALLAQLQSIMPATLGP